MACNYCFYLPKSDLYPANKSHRMNLEVVEEIIRQVMDQAVKLVTFIWQGGEPTLMGLDFYRQVIHFQEQYGKGKIVGNSFQTNGILIDYQWAEFFKEYNFLVGLSIDGPEHVHNYYRRQSGGRGTYHKVVDSANILLDCSVEVNALTVVNNYSVQYPEEIYTFHKQLGLTYMQFIPCVETDPFDPTRSAPYSATSEKYGKFLCRLFDLWVADFVDAKPTTSIRYFDSVFYPYVGEIPPECTILPVCGNYVVVEHNGDVYACDFFVEPRWKLGNVLSGDMIAMLNSERQVEFRGIKSNLPQLCNACRWLKYCYGGCTKDRFRDQRDGGLNHFCRSYQMFFEHADAQLRQLAENWLQEQIEVDYQKSFSETQKLGPGKVRRNDPCPCGSGKKYKKCCATSLILQ